MKTWLAGAGIGVLSMMFLLGASRTSEPAYARMGIFLFLLGVVAIFVLIHKHTGHPHDQRQNM